MDIFSGSSPVGIGLLAGAGCGVVVGWILRGTLSGTLFPTVETAVNSTGTAASFASSCGNYKMVLVVRNDLKMGKGKAAAQCCHAAVACCKKLMRKDPQVLALWERNGQPKVVVKVESQDDLIALSGHAQRVGVQSYLVQDAGRTQVEPGSRTVLGVGPGPAELVDEVTGHLKLY